MQTLNLCFHELMGNIEEIEEKKYLMTDNYMLEMIKMMTH